MLAENFTFEDFATEVAEEDLADVVSDKEEADFVDDLVSVDAWEDVSLLLTSTTLVDLYASGDTSSNVAITDLDVECSTLLSTSITSVALNDEVCATVFWDLVLVDELASLLEV